MKHKYFKGWFLIALCMVLVGVFSVPPKVKAEPPPPAVLVDEELETSTWKRKKGCWTHGWGWPWYSPQATYCIIVRYFVNGDGWVWIEFIKYRYESGVGEPFNGISIVYSTVSKKSPGDLGYSTLELYDHRGAPGSYLDAPGEVFKYSAKEWVYFPNDSVGRVCGRISMTDGGIAQNGLNALTFKYASC